MVEHPFLIEDPLRTGARVPRDVSEARMSFMMQDTESGMMETQGSLGTGELQVDGVCSQEPTSASRRPWHLCSPHESDVYRRNKPLGGIWGECVEAVRGLVHVALI